MSDGCTEPSDDVMLPEPPHKLLMIPGPIEVEPIVLLANASDAVSHVSAGFIEIFKRTLELLLNLHFTSVESGSQAFVVSGSGTLGWDMVAANLIEPGERALVLSNGYFGDAFKDCLETYGAKVDVIEAELGYTVTPEQLQKHLEEVNTKEGKSVYKLITITHCDTSTGVLADAQELSEVAKTLSPDSLVILDGVCSVAVETIYFDDWKLDVVLSASQKGLGTPPGLCILVASSDALKVSENRKSSPGSYYASWKKWLPVMKAYQSGSAAYFATPATNLITALYQSLKCILETPNASILERFARTSTASYSIKEAVKDLGLKQIVQDEEWGAVGMTAIYLPDNIKQSDVISKMLEKGVVIAGGLHKQCKDRYVRIGHMGITATEHKLGHVKRTIKALRETFSELGHVVG